MKTLRTVTKREPTPEELANMLFAWRVAKHVKSNAIVFAKDGATIGVGAGQMSRVDSARLAVWKAEEMAKAASKDRANCWRARLSLPTPSSPSPTPCSSRPTRGRPRSFIRAARCATIRSQRQRTSAGSRWSLPASATSGISRGFGGWHNTNGYKSWPLAVIASRANLLRRNGLRLRRRKRSRGKPLTLLARRRGRQGGLATAYRPTWGATAGISFWCTICHSC